MSTESVSNATTVEQKSMLDCQSGAATSATVSATSEPSESSKASSVDEAPGAGQRQGSTEADLPVSEKRVYVGNLPFKAHQDHIRDLFKEFTVQSVSLPVKRISRDSGGFYIKRLGFAFVELGSKDEANRAVEQLNGKLLLERRLSVKPAKLRSRSPSSDPDNTDGGDVQHSASSSANKKATSNRGGGGSDPKGSKSSKVQRAKAKAAKALSQKNSLTTIVVSNLPVGTTEEQVYDIFKDLVPKEIRLVTRSEKKIINKKRGEIIRPAKLLAFVEFSDEAAQKKALEDYNGKRYADVDLIIKIAVDLEKPVSSNKSAEADAAEVDGNAATEPGSNQSKAYAETETGTQAEAN